MNCETCKERQQQEQPVPFRVHESDMARQERNAKRWFIAWIITFVLFLASWAGFLWYESQWETVETWQEVTQDAGERGTNQFVGGDYYSQAESSDPYQTPGA